MSTPKEQILSFHDILIEKMNSFSNNVEPSVTYTMSEPMPLIDIATPTPIQRKFQNSAYEHIQKAKVSHQSQPQRKSESKQERNAPHRPNVEGVSVAKLSAAAQLALEVLGLPNLPKDKISIPQVKRAYRKLARESHPDLHPGVSPMIFAKITTSAEIVIDEISVLIKNKPNAMAA